ncbi:hypothetical protein HDU76_002444 [Blyttiomyces sp. JEL0837]|nr:hypothetical protein HDU76_002444 [Blyttiomyces sp. JEL0837]
MQKFISVEDLGIHGYPSPKLFDSLTETDTRQKTAVLSVLAGLYHFNTKITIFLMSFGLRISTVHGNDFGGKESPLSWAARLGYFEVVKYLCENATNENGWIWSEGDKAFALDCAIRRGTPEVVKYLHDIQHVPYPDDMALRGEI